MRRFSLSLMTAACAMLFAVGLAGKAEANDVWHVKYCHPVTQYQLEWGDPIVTKNGRVVKHNESYACPPAIINAVIHFDFDKSDIKPEFFDLLDRVAAQLLDNTPTLIMVHGHTDSIGSHGYNDKLAMERAQMVAAYLHSRGIPADHIQIGGSGERKPVATNGSSSGRYKNRRATIKAGQ